MRETMKPESKPKSKPRSVKKVVIDGISGEYAFTPDKPAEYSRNLDAERVVCASFMAHNSLFELFSDKIKPADFFDPLHRQIMEAGALLTVDNKPANRATIDSHITARAPIPNLSASAYLARLDGFIKPRAEIDAYVSEVKLAAKRRAVLALAERFKALAPSAGHDVIGLLSKEVAQLAGGGGDAGLVHLSGTFDATFQDILQRDADGFGPTGYLTGFPEIDDALGGLKKSKLYYIVANEKVGKSALALSVARNLMLQDIKIGIISLEMKNKELTERLITMESRVNTANRRKGERLNDTELEALSHAADRCASWPIWSNDLASLTASAIVMNARHAVKVHGVQVFIVDYLQIVNPEEGERDETRKRVEQASRALAKVAKELDIPVVALAQLNRKAIERATAGSWRDFKPDAARPRRGDLRETAQMEMDCDAIIAIYRPEILFRELKPFDMDGTGKEEDRLDYDNMAFSLRGKAELSVLLNRSGHDGVRSKCRFTGGLGLFEPQ
jgi:replicative DNA helicase